MDRRTFVMTAAAAGCHAMAAPAAIAGVPADDETVRVSLQPGLVKGPLPHTWEACIGSDRAVVGLRQQWLADLQRVKSETGMQSVRFHGLFSDEMGVLPRGAKAPNFLYVDMVFDALLAAGVRPFVELSFMPGALASGANTIFWYKGNVTPPTEMDLWGDLVKEFARHCVARYGMAEVRTWNFEVWNEPNIVFWSGTKAQYFELFRQSAVALKSVDSGLRVGGPATASIAWVSDLLDYCVANNVPIDFVSTHVYPDDNQKTLFGQEPPVSFEDVIPKALARVKGQITASGLPHLPLYLTEWSSQNPAFIAHTIKATVGLADILSYWTFDNVFEELGIPKAFINNAFGLIGTNGVPRPSFFAFALLHRLGATELDAGDGTVLATRRTDSSLAILVWNLVPVPAGQHSATGDPLQQVTVQDSNEGVSKTFVFDLEQGHKPLTGTVTRVDQEHGNFRRIYQQMGSPPYPTPQQIAEMKAGSAFGAPQRVALSTRNELSLIVPPNGLALLELA